MAMTSREEMTPREYQEFENQKTMFELNAAHATKMKELDIELMKLEAKWNSWIKIPVTIIKLPVLMLFGVAYIVGSFKHNYEPGDNFWKFLR